MPLYKIFAGLGGGFGGATEQGIVHCTDMKEAEDIAYLDACDQFESQEGCGMDGWNDFIDQARSHLCADDFITEEDYENEVIAYATELEDEAREVWIDYWAEEVDEDDEDDLYEGDTDEDEDDENDDFDD